MPYHVGAKGSYGCDGYPALKNGTNEVMGCHKTRKAAAGQIYAINRSEGNIGKAVPGVGDFVVFMLEEDEIHVGRVEFIMDQPGWLGLPDSEYAVETKEGQVGALVRCYEEEDGVWEEEPELYTLKLSELVRIDSLMVERALAKYNIDPSQSYFIGDKPRDIQCAEKAGVTGIKIDVNVLDLNLLDKIKS